MSTSPDNIDEQEIESWFQEHADGLFRFALLRINDREIAEDLVQETFLSAIKSKSSFEGRSSVRTWLVGILKFKIADHFRNASKFKGSIEYEDAEQSISNQFGALCWARGFGPKPWGDDPANLTENNQLLKVVKQCLDELPERFRNIFTLREMEGEQTHEIGNIFGITSANVRTILYRARALMRSCLENHWFMGKNILNEKEQVKKR